MKIALAVGHSRFVKGRRDGGAVSVGGVAEWTWNLDLAKRIQVQLTSLGVESIIIDHYEGSGYGSAMRWLAARLKALKVEAVIELHFNAAGPDATGHEWPHWHSSRNGQHLASLIKSEVGFTFPELLSRGLKPRIRPRAAKERRNNRGWQFLNYTHCPAVIAEPFFGSNVEDWQIVTRRKEDLAQAIAEGIASYAVGA